VTEHQVTDEIIEALKKIPAEERQQWLNKVMLFLAYAPCPSRRATPPRRISRSGA
jgi:hypothetical protein